MENHVYHTLSLHENRVSVSSSSKSWHKIFEQSSYSAMLHIWESVPPPESIPSDSWNSKIESRQNSGIGWNQFRPRNQFRSIPGIAESGQDGIPELGGISSDAGISSTNSGNSGIGSQLNSVQSRNHNILCDCLSITPCHSTQLRYGIPGIGSRQNW
jgi:hypothetical protein